MDNKRYSNIRWRINQDEIDFDSLEDHLSKIIYVSYSKFQLENDEKNNLRFYHGYSELSTRKRINQLKNDFLSAEIEDSFPTQKENINYFSNSKKRVEGPWEIGSLKVLRKKTLDERWLDIRNGLFNSYQEVFDLYPSWSVRNSKSIKEMIEENASIVNSLSLKKKKRIWIYGNSGSGKTTLALKELIKAGYNFAQICIKKAPTKSNPKIWFSDEDRLKKVLVIEEVRLGYPDAYDIISLFDGDKLEIKGNRVINNFEEFVIMSINSPEEIYENSPIKDQIQILRRLDYSIEVFPDNGQISALQELKVSQRDFIEIYQPITIDRTAKLKNYLFNLNKKIDKINENFQNLENKFVEQTKMLELFEKKTEISLETILTKLDKDKDPSLYERISDLVLKRKSKESSELYMS